MQIESGTGNGRVVGVSAENRLLVQAVDASVEHHANHHHGRAYNALFSQTAAGTDDCIFYMKNEDELDLVVEGVRLAASAAGDVYIQVSDNGTPGGDPTTVTPVNLNLGSGRTAAGTFYQDPDITGLSGGTEIVRYVFTAATGSTYFNFEQDLIIPKNEVMTIWSSAAITIKGTVIFNYHSKDSG